MTCGVYTITAPSGKCYVGSSVNMEARRQVHFSNLRRRCHHSRALQSAWNKYGERLTFHPLLICARHHRLWYEQRAIDALRPKYNGLPTATCGAVPGHAVSEETREKLSRVNSGRRMGAAVSLPWLGKTLSPEHRAKLSAARSGKPGPALGRTVSVETRAKISDTLKGRQRSESSRAKQSMAWAAKREPPCR